ncbi:hypothetical protein BaRGS_00037251 [Batillaria attramentaria]|uniref:Uncharacterized protein n=1 Tax=Batillaria attramentaria TaxID=370345 RepID=A0ABD0JA65_9CAEN
MANQRGRKTSSMIYTKLRRHAYLFTLFLKNVASGLFVTQSQYVYRRVADEYTDDLDAIENATSEDTCGVNKVNTSSPGYQIYAQISAESSRWTMYQTLSSGLPPIITILILGAYSDQVGRRVLFLLPLGATAIRGAILSLVIYFDLHLAFVLVGEFVEGLTGGSLMIATFSYTSDQHNTELETEQGRREERKRDYITAAKGMETFKEGGVTGISYTSSSGDVFHEPKCDEIPSDASHDRFRESPSHETDDGENLATEKILENGAIPEYDRNRAVRLLAIECFNDMCMGVVQLFNGYLIDLAGAIRHPRRLSAFILCNLAVMLLVFGDGGIIRTLPIYQMSPPFCWTSVKIGWFNMEFYFTTILSVPFLMFLKRFNLSEPTMAGIGGTVNALGTAVYALANVYSWVFFVVAALTPPGMLAYALTRTISSRLAGPEAHGDNMDQMLADFAVEEGLDCWDIAVIHQIVQMEEERLGLDRNFSLHKYTDQQCKDHFRFFPQDIIRLCQLLHMPDRMTAVNRTSASGLEVLCIVLKRLSYPCRYLDLEGFFHRPRFELCMLFNLGVNHIDGMFSERLTNPAQPWLTIAKLHEYSAAVYMQRVHL